MFILTMILFSGQVINQEYPSAKACNDALYSAMDKIFIKNIEQIECKVVDKQIISTYK